MNRKILPLYFLTFVNVLGFAVLIPVFPFLVENFGGNELAFGILIALYPIFQFIGAPILGSLSDVFGRRPVLFISQTGTLISWIVYCLSFITPVTPLFGTTFTLPLLVLGISRAADGITGGNFSVAIASLSDIVEKEHKTRIFGAIGAIFGIGLIVGPLIGGYTSSFAIGYLGVGVFSILLSFITLLSMYLYLPETLPPSKRGRLNINVHTIVKDINIYRKIRSYNSPLITKLFFMRAFFAFVLFSYTTTIVFYLKGVLKLSTGQIGYQFLLLGIFFMLNQTVIVPYIAQKIGNLQTYYIGQIVLFFGLLALPFTARLWAFIPITFLTTIGVAASVPTFKALITDLVNAKRQGEITGLDESVFAGATAFAPIFAGGLYTIAREDSYFVFAAILLIPFLAIRLRTGKFRA